MDLGDSVKDRDLQRVQEKWGEGAHKSNPEKTGDISVQSPGFTQHLK